MATTKQKLPTNSVGEDTILPLQIKITAKTREANSLPYKFVLSNCSTNQNLKRKRNGYNLTKKHPKPVGTGVLDCPLLT